MNPVTDEVLHISFYVTDKNTEITSEVPVELTGLAPAQDMGIGFVIQSLNEIHVRCLPANLPDHFEVDVTGLANIGDSILVGDLKLPEGVELDSDMDPTTAIVSVVGAQKIEEEATEAAPELDADGNPIVKAEGEEGAEGEKSEEGSSAE
jgi:large subunit ribosomal protein L25